MEHKFDGYTLIMEETNRRARTGQVLVNYVFTSPSGDIIFKGDDFGASPLHDATGIESARALLGFLTVQKGDVDEEYFNNYTFDQIAFSESFDCERLRSYTFED